MATISGEIHQFKNKAGTKNWWPRTVTEAIYGLDSTIADVKTWVGNNYVSALGTNGNYLTWTKGGTANNITVPYATTADGANHAFWLNTNNTIAFGKSGLQYFSIYGTEGTSTTENNTPTSAWYHILRMNHGDSDGYFADIAIHLSGSNGIYWRRIAGGTNLGWFRVLDSNNFASIIGTTTYAPYNSYGYMYGTVDTNIVEQNGSETDTWANLGYADSHKGKADFKIVRHTNGVGAHFGGIGMNYGSTIFYGSSDTRGYMSLAYSAPLVVFGGGSLGTSSASAAPAWYIGIKGTSGTTYDLGTISSQAANGDSAYNSLSNYLPLKAQGETVYRTTSGQIVNFNNSKGANEEAYLVLQSNGTSKAAVGWSTTYGTYIYNYASAKYLGIKDDGTPHYQGNTLYHAGNANLNTVPWACSTLTASGDITTSGKVIVGTGGSNGSAVGSDAASNIYLANSAGVPLVADGLVVRRGSAATNGQLGNTTYRWANIYSVNGNFSGAVSIPDLTGLARIEFTGTSSSGNGGYLDFHFNGSTADYTSRIVETASGLLRINSYLNVDRNTGRVGVGTYTPSYKLDVTDVIHSTVGIFSDGYVSALGTASSSDAKLKDDITTISYDRAKEVLFALNPSEWTWNALTSKEGERGAGMVAQEVESILPDTVKEIGGNLTLEYNTLFAYGLAATKYMLPMVETHEEKIARLEKEVEELKRQLTN